MGFSEKDPKALRFSPRVTFPLAALTLLAVPLTGCVVPLIAGTAVGGYTLATEQRTPQQLARDAGIGAAAHKYWADASSDLARDLTATVYNNDLLITGIVPNQQMKDAGEKFARQIDGVGKIYNRAEVGQPTTFGQDARDNYVSNALRAQMLGDGNVRSSNYIVHTLNGIVYIMGYARNQAENDIVLAYARNLPNVTRVNSFIHVGNEPSSPPPSNAAPNNQPPPPVEAPPDTSPPPSPAPRGAPIEVQPLQWNSMSPSRWIRSRPSTSTRDSTFVLALEAQARGHALYHYLPRQLSLTDGRSPPRRGASKCGANAQTPRGAGRCRDARPRQDGCDPDAPGSAFRHGLYHGNASARACPAAKCWW